MSVECGQPGRPLDLAKYGPQIRVQIGFDHDYQVEIPLKKPRIPEASFVGVVDTGANQTSIDIGVADRLRLPLVDKTDSVNVHGVVKSNMYAVHMYFPDLDYPAIGTLVGTRLSETGFNCDLLLGRDFLKDIQMLYDGRTGSVKLARQ